MKVDTFACDNCGKQRDKDTNHWFILNAHIDVIVNDIPIYNGIEILNWSSDANVVRNSEHACGQQCAIDMTQRFLSTGSFERKPAGEAARER